LSQKKKKSFFCKNYLCSHLNFNLTLKKKKKKREQ